MRTTHGDHIPGTRLGNNPPLKSARCGGITSCPDCMLEAAAIKGLDYNREEIYTEKTVLRVFDSLREAGVDAELAQKAVLSMQKYGILFRERKNQ